MKSVAWVFAIAALGMGAVPAMAEEARCPNLAGTAHVLPSPQTIAGAQAHVFKTAGGTALRLHVFRPTGRGRHPAVLIFFGGGWMNGTVDGLEPVARHLAEQGLVAILADYRTFCRNGADVADEVADANAAMIWVRSHAKEVGADPRRIAALGGSSGGHLALSTAIFAGKEQGISSRPDLLLLFYPCVDLTAQYELDYSAQAISTHGAALSPLFHLRADLPPTVVFQGSEDPLYQENKRFCDESRQLGASCQWREFPGAGHGFFNPSGPAAAKWFAPGLAALNEALRSAGYLPPSA